MKVPAWVKPGIWGAIVGAIAIMILGFWQMGWTTAGTANRMATDRAEAAVAAVLVPFCVANAERDPDQAGPRQQGGSQTGLSQNFDGRGRGHCLTVPPGVRLTSLPPSP